jgi:hypothetical protein
VFGASCVKPAPSRGRRLTSMTIGRCRECRYCSWGTPTLVIATSAIPVDAYTPSGQVRPVFRLSECTYVVNSVSIRVLPREYVFKTSYSQ